MTASGDSVSNPYDHIPELDPSDPPKIEGEERKELLSRFYPDYRPEHKSTLRVGPNRGDVVPDEISRILESRSVLETKAARTVPDAPDADVDLLIIGGGGAGMTAALFAQESGAKVLLATKLRVGDSNTVMAEGGIQVALGNDDSPVNHFKDAYRGGHFAGNPELLSTLVKEGPDIIGWLVRKGVLFDRDAGGNLSLRKGGGTSRPRLISAKDYTGLEIVRVLKEDLLNSGVAIWEFSPAVELLEGPEGSCAGAIFRDVDSGKLKWVKAKSVLLTTGGTGRLHIGSFATSNHFGATGDGLVMAYRLGAELINMDSFQYHPTGVIYPSEMAGMLITEAVRGAGARLYNKLGKRFVPELETRDVVAASIIRECEEGRGVKTPAGHFGVYLDLASIDRDMGEGTVAKRFPNIVKLMGKHQVDCTVQPILVYPTLHYQNGGITTDVMGHSSISHLYVAGEVSGGVHGKNRLMGNSLLEVFVYGRRVGIIASQEAQKRKPFSWQDVSVEHVGRFESELDREFPGSHRSEAPLLFPDYRTNPDNALA
jgi:succinate dehydrogenase/fumarate reductase flavoprotein subunit